MSRKISNYFLVKPKETSSKNVELESSFTTTSEDAEGGAGDAEDHNRVENAAGSTVRADTIVTPNQPKNFQFPKKDYGKQSRSFQSSWFKDYPWLHYDEISDSAFCYICISQNNKGNLTSARNMEKTFISTGFQIGRKLCQDLKSIKHQSATKLLLITMLSI